MNGMIGNVTHDISLKEGELSGVLAALENLCWRVCFLPSVHDLPSLLLPAGPKGATRKVAPMLSSTSVNVHGRDAVDGVDTLKVGGLANVDQATVESLPLWKAGGGDTVFLADHRSPADLDEKADVMVPIQVSNENTASLLSYCHLTLIFCFPW